MKFDDDSRVVEAEFAQPLCTAVQIALVNLHWGITPDAVVRHSSGEIAAAYASGALSAEVAILVAYFRGQAMKTFSSEHHGGMAAVGLGSEKARPFLKPGVVIACDNSPESVTLSGDSDTLGEVLDGIHAHDNEIFCRQLAVNVAYHSHHMVEAGEVYEKMVHPHCAHKLSMAPMYSNVSGTIISDPSILNAVTGARTCSPPFFSTRQFNGSLEMTTSQSYSWRSDPIQRYPVLFVSHLQRPIRKTTAIFQPSLGAKSRGEVFW